VLNFIENVYLNTFKKLVVKMLLKIFFGIPGNENQNSVEEPFSGRRLNIETKSQF
jgi:hypothetical protein